MASAIGAFVLTGCGSGSGESGKVELIARDTTHAKHASCKKVRDAAPNGRIVKLYACTLTGIPDAYKAQVQPVSEFGADTTHLCFAYASGEGMNVDGAGANVTSRFGLRCETSK